MEAKIDVESVEKRLKKEYAVLEKRVQAEREKAKPSLMSNPDRADLALDYGHRERRLSLLEQLEDKLSDLTSALDRIEEGTYGLCADCGESITPGRLRALPSAELCIDCQRKL